MVKHPSEEDRVVLEHVFRYRLTLPRILAGTGIFSGVGEHQAQEALERLRRDGWLSSAELYPGHRTEQYFHLSERAAKFLGQDAVVAQPLKHDMRVECFAIATFCCCGKPFRELMTKEEFKIAFAKLWYPGQPIRHYLDKGDDGSVRLAFIKVDTAGTGRWDRLIDSCSHFLRQRTDESRIASEHHPHAREFSRFVERDQFQFTVLTALPEKKRAIELELARRTLSREPVPPITVHVVPELFEAIFPAPPR